MIAIRSFAKINLGLKIGVVRADGFHELRTIYQTLALHDRVRVDVQPGSGIEIRCEDARVPRDQTNTCYKIAEQVLQAAGLLRNGATEVPQGLKSGFNKDIYGTAKAVPLQSQIATEHHPSGIRERSDHGRARVIIEIEKRLPVRGGLGAASSNGVATMLALEHALGVTLSPQAKLRFAADVGSDLPLFLIGGTVLGVGRGEEVYPLPDLPPLNVVIVTPAVGISTPQAFARWDKLAAPEVVLTGTGAIGTINEFCQNVFAWLSEDFHPQGWPASGVPAGGGDRAETPLLDLVRAGIENDFERVVFPEYPELREVKELLQRAGAHYASLSGSGSTVYGLFPSGDEAEAAAERMRAAGYGAIATTTLRRQEYWTHLASGREPRAAS